MSTAVQVAVVGAGAAGLAAARELRRAGLEVAVLDAGDRPGGVMQSQERRGFLFERGPNSFRIPAPVHAFLRRHGLADALLAAGPEARLRQLLLDGRLVAAPQGPLGALRSPILSGRGKLRALGEPFVRRGDASGESVAEFVSRRFGPELVERAVAPVLVGIYAGDETRLGAEAVLPSLVRLEREHGSVLGGGLRAALRRGGERGLPGSWSAQAGLGGLAERLAAGLGDGLRLGTRVLALERHAGDWRLALEPGGELRAGTVLLATPAPAAAALLRPLDAELAALLDGIEYAPVVSLALDVDPSALERRIQGIGFLVPRQAELSLLGALFMSRVFPGRAPAGRELVMAMLGGLRWPEATEASDAELLAQASEGLARALGLRGEPGLLAVSRWPRAIPQPGRDHPARVRSARERAAKLPGVALAGGYLAGVAVGDALVSGARAAEALVAS